MEKFSVGQRVKVESARYNIHGETGEVTEKHAHQVKLWRVRVPGHAAEGLWCWESELSPVTMFAPGQRVRVVNAALFNGRCGEVIGPYGALAGSTSVHLDDGTTHPFWDSHLEAMGPAFKFVVGDLVSQGDCVFGRVKRQFVDAFGQPACVALRR